MERYGTTDMARHTPAQGFTLIELLVVIAIIGILSSVILASLNTARTKGADAARMADVHSLETAMELYFSDNNSYPQAGASGTGNSLSALTAFLVPKYIPVIPAILIADSDQYVWGPSNAYGLYIYTAVGGTYCRTGANVNAGWWAPVSTCSF